MDATGAVITFAVGLGGVALGAWLSRRNQKRSANDRLLVEAINDVVGAIAEVANGATGEAQWRYASAVSRIALHAPPEVVGAFRRFQDEATTATSEGRALLIAAVQAARQALGHQKVVDGDLAILLFGAHEGSFELAWTRQQASLDIDLEKRDIDARPDIPAPTDAGLDEARALAASSPAQAIVRAYDSIENRLVRLADAQAVSRAVPSDESSRAIEERLLGAGVLSEKTAHAVRGVAAMRNLAVHASGDEPTAKRAEEFIALADGVLYAIDAEARKREP